MYIGGYTLNCYCDKENKKHKYDEFPHEFIGQSKGECFNRARKRGWTLKRDGSCLCPKCSGKQIYKLSS